MDIKEALRRVGYDELADPEARKKVFRQVKFELQRRADQGDTDVDIALLNEAIEVFDRWIDGGDLGPHDEQSTAARAMLMLTERAGAQPAEPARVGAPPPADPPGGAPAPVASTGSGGAGILAGIGLAAFGALMFALGASVASDEDGDDEY